MGGMSNIINPQQMQMASEAEPAEILVAIHKRIVDTEKLMQEYRNFAKNQQLEIEMLKERMEKLEKIEEDEQQQWRHTSAPAALRNE